MNALTITQPTNAEVYRASTDAAGLCRDIVLKTAMNIQGRKYVKAEGWLAIAIAHGCIASADQVERVNDEGFAGFRAIGTIRRMSDGVEVSRAEGFVGDDESMWAKRPVYARRAMAQTRAISRACRSAFAHVVVLIDANLSTTPAEEVPDGGFVDEPRQGMRNVTPAAGAPAEAQHAADIGRGRVDDRGVKRLSSAEAKRIGLHDTLKDGVWGCKTLADLDDWEAEFADHTAQAPLSWLDAVRNDLILRREELSGSTNGDDELDAEFKAVVSA